MTDRYICVHGHFYQPPRENPWLETIEIEDSARSYHDWNARVTAECYAPNGAARVLDAEGRIAEITNNYAQISFNIGPTLLAWMAHAAPETYARILAADRESRAKRHGHGNALAQAYNHMILPLATRRDKDTQVAWGIADFWYRFGRAPEGLWLPETAVDTETLEVLASRGIAFTILAPHQAARVRPLGGGAWTDVGDGRVDPRRPYVLPAPERRRDHSVLLRRPDLARRRVRGAAEQRRGVRQSVDRRVRRGSAGPPPSERRHRRGVLRAPPPVRRDGLSRPRCGWSRSDGWPA